MDTEAEQIIGLYRRHALAWAKLRGPLLFEQFWLDRFIALLPETPSVLDVGCGSGEPIGRHLLDKGTKVTGIDASPELIAIAKRQVEGATWIVSDMRDLQLRKRFQGILAWNSTFHLTPDDQRQMFPIFEQHAAKGTVLMFTSGPSKGEAIGKFEGEPLYHSSLDEEEYRDLLNQHGFEVVDHVVEDPDCGHHTIWLAQFHSA